MIAPVITLQNVKVQRAHRTILSIDDLQINSGEFIGVIGTNGAGKTTLLKICSGILKPSFGSVTLNQQDLSKLNSWQKTNLRKLIGYIPQSAEYNAELPYTVHEIVTMGRTCIKPLLKSINNKDRQIIDQWIEHVGLAGKHNQTFRSLSGGEQQKVLIARAMVQEPAILMLDEPCANLDFDFKYQVSELVNTLYKETNVTVLMVSHETSVLPDSCERIILLHNGILKADGPVASVLNNLQLNKVYSCDIKLVDIDGRKYTAAKKNN
jgi:ABC-type cobalamin/Fe3+-siderophores transport system ATPase subunit